MEDSGMDRKDVDDLLCAADECERVCGIEDDEEDLSEEIEKVHEELKMEAATENFEVCRALNEVDTDLIMPSNMASAIPTSISMPSQPSSTMRASNMAPSMAPSMAYNAPQARGPMPSEAYQPSYSSSGGSM